MHMIGSTEMAVVIATRAHCNDLITPQGVDQAADFVCKGISDLMGHEIMKFDQQLHLQEVSFAVWLFVCA